MLAATGLVLFMTPGLAFFYGGMVQHHSIISTMLQCMMCIGVISVLWIIFGFSLAFGDDRGHFIGDPWTYLWFRNVGTAPSPTFGTTIPFQLYALFQLKFAVLTPGLTAGGYIERIRFGPFLLYIMLFMTVIYCPVAHWVWHPNGFLCQWGILDFAGGTVVHMTSGYSALAGAVAIGRRRAVKRGQAIYPNNIPFVILGTGMLWFGWFGFNGGSALTAGEGAAQAFINTNTATAAAMVMWMVIEGVHGKKPSAVGACVGAVVGLVIITPACGYVTVGESLFFGGFGAIVCYTTVWLMHKTPIDDGLDAFGTHGIGGTIGSILTGAFSQNVGVVHGPAGENWKYFGWYWAGITIVGVWSFCISFILFKGIDLVWRIRLSPEEEDFGLDETQHGESLYKGAGLGDTVYSNAPLMKDEEPAVEMPEVSNGAAFDPSYPVYPESQALPQPRLCWSLKDPLEQQAAASQTPPPPPPP
eukprot:GGOE01057495.1.p1 GENE.GGOE01057495.1~~GGOE01057495.1.p1  ORF type:complete len:497 (+),score=131.14 GGOE01057495.1:78-1493(+)